MFFVVSAIIGILFYVYVKYERPQQQEVLTYMNISIASYISGRQIPIELTVEANDVFLTNKTTTETGFVLVKVPINSTVKIFVSDDRFYYEEIVRQFADSSNKRISINVKAPGNLTITSDVDLDNSQINLEVVSSTEFRQPKLCIDWGLHIIRVSNIDNLTRISSEDYDRCYLIDSINSTAIKNSFSYNYYGVFTNADFVRFYFIDEKERIVVYMNKFINS